MIHPSSQNYFVVFSFFINSLISVICRFVSLFMHLLFSSPCIAPPKYWDPLNAQYASAYLFDAAINLSKYGARFFPTRVRSSFCFA